MRTRCTRSGESIRLAITGEASPDGLERLRRRLLDLGSENPASGLIIDLRRVERPTLPLVQLVLAARRTGEQRGTCVELVAGPDDVFFAAASSAGLVEELGLAPGHGEGAGPR